MYYIWLLDNYNKQKYFNKLNKLFIINKIPRDCSLIGKDIVNYLERGINPIFYSDNDFFNNKIKSNSKVKRISTRDIEKGFVNGQFITYKYQDNSFKGEVYTKVRRNISYNIKYKFLAYDILENPSEYKFFKDKCEDLNSFLSKKEQFLNISALLDFKDHYKI